MKGTVWVLTCECNDYDQHGEYFVSVFKCKPATDQLSAEIGHIKDSKVVQNLLNGGGRIDAEYTWWNLRDEKLK